MKKILYYKNILLKNIFLLLSLVTVISCGVPKNISYLQGLKNLEEINTKEKNHIKYKPQDVISILVSADDEETAIPFNANTVSNSNEENNSRFTNKKASKYLVDSNGNIEFPILGKLKVSNLTSLEVKEMIENKLNPYIKNPIVNVKLANFKITILGEVNNPGSILIDDEQISILEAIGIAGDLKLQGKRDNLLVIRKENDKHISYKIDLTSKDIFNSPVYYLKQNDIIYIEPNRSRKKESRGNESTRILSTTSSILGIIISLILILR